VRAAINELFEVMDIEEMAMYERSLGRNIETMMPKQE
jgi:hypothetical protein